MWTGKVKFGGTIVAPLIALFLVSCGKDTGTEQSNRSARPAKLIVVEPATSGQTLRLPAVIGASTLSHLSFPVGGVLQKLHVTEAQQVKKGDVIAELDQRDFQTNLTADQAKFDNADSEYQRAVRLAKQNAIAQNVLEQRKSQLDTAQAQLDTSKKALDDTILEAPFSGVIAKVDVKRLENIQPGAIVTSVMGTRGMEATVNLPAKLITHAKNQTNQTSFVLLDGAEKTRIPATFKEASLVADPVSQTYELTFNFTPPEHLIILPGMNAIMELGYTSMDADSQDGHVSVPLGSIFSDGEQQHVWVVDTNTMAVSKRSVVVEDSIGEDLTVTQGLQPGDTIIGAGASYLSDGVKVRPWTK